MLFPDHVLSRFGACFEVIRYGARGWMLGFPTWMIWICSVWVSPLGHSQVAPSFDRVVQPILDRSCVPCHGADTQKGGLRLDGLDAMALGGSSGPAIIPGKIEESSLVARLLHTDADERMPPPDKPSLTESEIDLLVGWIKHGAPELAQAESHPFPEEAYQHWSLKPLVSPDIPQLGHALAAWIQNPIDAFILEQQLKHGLTPSAEADRRTLMRRLYFDLTGLPPSPEALRQFESSQDPLAYEKLVDALLASHDYGERWARHWLDVVHYADTHGYDKDKPRPHAWPYRDYVIRSLNQDKPYSTFVEEQLAGDILYPESMDGVTATGFIATGPWDFIGHAEVSEDKLDGRIARHLDRDDMVTTAMNTFVSTTVQCARCHHHKFDPVRMEDYYRLQAVFAALDRADRQFDADPSVAMKRREWSSRAKEIQDEIGEIQDHIEERAGESLLSLNKTIASLEKAKARKPDAYGYHSEIAASPDTTKWVQVDLGMPQVIHQISLHACDDDFNGIGAGFGFPVRFRIETSNDVEFAREKRLVFDGTQADQVHPGTLPKHFKTDRHSARFVRVTATRLALRSNDYIFALAELQVNDEEGKNIALHSNVTALDSIEAPVRWAKNNLVDGVHVGLAPRDASGRSLPAIKAERDRLLQASTTAEWKQRLKVLNDERALLETKLGKLPPPSKVYAGTIHHGSGAFRGRGHLGGRPRPIHVLARGDVAKPGREVGPGAVPVIYGQSPSFNLAASHAEGERRVALARWILQKDHPLTWRSIVNRVWHYHFGAGICETPNDFGQMGGTPSHPALLDWLAVHFRDGGQSFKQLHRLILTSATYRQASTLDAQKANLDGNNRFLWRMNRRRLEAEALRDSVLNLAGVLDRKMGGPAFQDFVIEKPEHSPHYQYHLHDPMDAASHRRSVYRFIVRSQQQPFMTTLDCADPSLMVGRRNETLTPTQSLALLNHPFMLAMAETWAGKLSGKGATLRMKIAHGFEEATGKVPAGEELDRWTRYAEKHGLANTCRWMLNMNGFIFVD